MSHPSLDPSLPRAVRSERAAPWRALAWLGAGVLLASGLGGWSQPARAQDRRDDERAPRWAQLLTEALRAEREAKPRYELHGARVFDTQTGRSYLLEDDKFVRIEDPLAQQVVRRRLDTIDQTIGGVIRAR